MAYRSWGHRTCWHWPISTLDRSVFGHGKQAAGVGVDQARCYVLGKRDERSATRSQCATADAAGIGRQGPGYGTERIVCREPTVPKLFLINVALYAALVMAAASIVVRHRRRSRGRPLVPVRRRRGTIAEPVGEDTAQNDIAAAPRLGSDSGAPGSGPDLPAEPTGTAESKALDAPSLGPGPRGPEAEPDGPQGDARAATSDEPIVSYYEQADRPMSDYLETLGWPHKPKIYDPGAADADSAPELEEAAVSGRRPHPRQIAAAARNRDDTREPHHRVATLRHRWRPADRIAVPRLRNSDLSRLVIAKSCGSPVG